MANCIIRPIPIVRTLEDRSRMTYRLNMGEKINFANYAWYIEGAREKTLVDTGGTIEFFAKQGALDKAIQTLDTGLSNLGVGFDDVELVILTHLHQDHVAQAPRFTKARFLVQKDELEFALNPHPAVAVSFNKEYFEGLNFEIISGDIKISDEISVISTPGHTPGGQSVCVKTAQGTVVIAGLCSLFENFEPPPPLNETMPVIAPTYHSAPLLRATKT